MEIQFIPYLIKDGNQTIKFGKNKLTDLALSKKSLIKKLVKQILWPFKIKKYSFDKEITVKIEKDKKFFKKFNLETDEEIKNYFIETYGNSKHLIGESGPDSWMEGNIVLIKKGEIDDNDYEFGIATKKITFEKLRPSPTQSATLFKVGTIKKGNDGNRWIVKKSGKSVRWVKII